MAFPILDTPRTDAGDQSYLSAAGAPEFTTEMSIPSPTKEGTDLLRQMKSTRAPTRNLNATPRSRAPLVDRRNVLSKTEFTPLLKSATRNRASGLFKGVSGKENGILQTPTGLKPSYHIGHDSPALPLSSSIMEDQYTGSFMANESQHSPAMPVDDSSIISTHIPILPGRGEGPLDHGNVATLKEQEARLEQIDKENFSLKLKIHFIEEALRRNGKEFNEAAIKENTELKVDKVTLQRDLKQYRKLLAHAERDLEEYKRRTLEHAEKGEQNRSDGTTEQALESLRTDIAAGEERIDKLERELERADEDAYNRCNDDNRTALNELRDTIADLEAELRDKDRQLDEQQDMIDKHKTHQQGNDDLKVEVQELKDLVKEKEDDVLSLQEAFRKAGQSHEYALREKDRALEQKDDQLKDTEDQLKGLQLAQIRDSQADTKNLMAHDEQLAKLQEQLKLANSQLLELPELRQKLETAEINLISIARERVRDAEDKDLEIASLKQRMDSACEQGNNNEDLNHQIINLKAELRENERLKDEKDDEIEDLQGRLQHLENETDDELIAAQDRIQELEIDQERCEQELATLRDTPSTKDVPHIEQQLKEAHAKLAEFQETAKHSREEERRLQAEMDQLHGQLQRQNQSLEDLNGRYAAERKSWSLERQALEFAKASAEKQITMLRETNSQLHQIEGSLSSKESQLQYMLDSERKRHENDEAQLRKDIALADERAATEHRVSDNLRQDLVRLRKDLLETNEKEHKLGEKIVELEEEVEVLQVDADEEIATLKSELQDVQHELVKVNTNFKKNKSDLELLRASQPGPSTPLLKSAPSPLRNLRERVLELETQLMTVKIERDELQERLKEAERLRNDREAETEEPSGSSAQWQQKMSNMQTQLLQTKKERRTLEDSTAMASTELKLLQSSYDELEHNHSTIERQLRETRAQLAQTQREAARKLQTQIAAYEHDIENLEQDLADAERKSTESMKTHEALQAAAAQHQSRIATLEGDIVDLRNAKNGAAHTSPQERRDLHDLLKKAKLEAEDLALRIKQRDSQVAIASQVETDLRAQLRCANDEYAILRSRERSCTAENERLQNQIVSLEKQTSDMLTLRQKVQSFPSEEQRHTAELRGLARQIEYLSARCRREEAFRSDLGFIKQYFQKTVEMHGRCNLLDLKLVRSMGIATSQILRDEQQKERLEGPGRISLSGSGVGHKRKGLVAIEPRSRPTLRVAGFMILAAVRMERAAISWAAVRGRHEELLKKLRGVRKEREERAKVKDQTVKQQNGSKRKTLR